MSNKVAPRAEPAPASDRLSKQSKIAWLGMGALDPMATIQHAIRGSFDEDVSKTEGIVAHVDEVARRTKDKNFRIDEKPTVWEKAAYFVENYASSDGNAMLTILVTFTLVATVILGFIWAVLIRLGGKNLNGGIGGDRRLALGDDGDEGEEAGSRAPIRWLKSKGSSNGDDDDDAPTDTNGRFSVASAMSTMIWYSFQLISVGGIDDSIGDGFDTPIFSYLECLLVTVMLIFGLVVFAILVGIITDNVTGIMGAIEDGSMGVVEEGHTLILGWNQASVRLVCQISFLRRQYQTQNETLARVLFPWLRVRPSTPVASSRVVILANASSGLTKVGLQELLSRSLDERGILMSHTRVGWDIVVRVGDPASVADLLRVNASSATSIVLMMTSEDRADGSSTSSDVGNGATIRTLLALRSVLCSHAEAITKFDERGVRIVVQLSSDSKSVMAACFRTPAGKKITTTIEVTRFVNTLLFLCASKPGLSQVVLSAYNFAESSFRARLVSDLRAGPEADLGYFVGMSFADACATSCWAEAILVGITNDGILYGPRAGEKLQGPKGEILGIVPQPDYLIRATDSAIFIGPQSQPTCSRNQAATREHIALELDAARRPTPGHAASVFNPFSVSPLDTVKLNEQLKLKQMILVCGWRPFWTKDNDRLRNRIGDVAKYAAPGSRLCFLNQMPTDGEPNGDDFATRVAKFAHPLDPASPSSPKQSRALPHGFKKGWTLDFCPNLNIYHVQGNAADEATLGSVLAETGCFRHVIVLGTQHKHYLDPKQMDTRVMAILLMLKHLTLDWNVPPHVTSENQLDQTADVAVTPGGHLAEPDFVNTQAFTARSLAMALAYPSVQPALKEMFEDEDLTDGSPEFDLLPSEVLGLTNKRLSFGVIQQVVSMRFKGWAIAIGVIDVCGHLTLAPGIMSLHTWHKDDFLVIIRRDLPVPAHADKHEHAWFAKWRHVSAIQEPQAAPEQVASDQAQTQPEAHSQAQPLSPLWSTLELDVIQSEVLKDFPPTPVAEPAAAKAFQNFAPSPAAMPAAANAQPKTSKAPLPGIKRHEPRYPPMKLVPQPQPQHKDGSGSNPRCSGDESAM